MISWHVGDYAHHFINFLWHQILLLQKDKKKYSKLDSVDSYKIVVRILNETLMWINDILEIIYFIFIFCDTKFN